MRNLFLAVLLCILGPCTAYPAFYFGTGTQRITLADNPALDLPNSPWTIALRGRETTRVDSARLFTRNRDGLTDVIRVYLGDTGGFEDEVYVEITDGSGNAMSFPVADGTAIMSGDPFTLILSRGADGFVRMYINNTLVTTSTTQLTTGINSSEPLYIGNRNDSARPFDGSLSDFAIWNSELSAADRAAYHLGFSSSCFSSGRIVLMSMIGQYIEIQTGIPVTNNGTTISAHPRIISCR